MQLSASPCNRPGPAPGVATSFLVLADDLSGASECAAVFSRPEQPVSLWLAALTRSVSASTTVCDLDARDRVAELDATLSAQLRGTPGVFIKVDSLLRGHWAALLVQLQRASARPVVLCPALPRLGRAVQDGRLWLAPAEQARLRAHRHGRDLLADLRDEGVVAGGLCLDAATDQERVEALVQACERQPVTLVDAATATDLERLASALLSMPSLPLVSGSAGLLNALAALRDGRAPERWSSRLEAPVAVLVGSLTPAARAQLERLAEVSRVPVRWWHPGTGLFAQEAAPVGRDENGRDDARLRMAHPLRLYATLGEVDESPGSGRETATQFARAVMADCRQARSLIVTGGETARALCEHLGAERLAVLGEIEDGVCVARLPGQDGPLLVTKSGSFGDRDTLLRVVRHGWIPLSDGSR